MIKAVWKKNLPVLEHVIRNVKQNSRIKEGLVSICVSINAWRVSASNQIILEISISETRNTRLI